MPWISLGSSGSVTYCPNWASFHGMDALNLSLSLSGMTTSLTSGIPSRDTWANPPTAVRRWVPDPDADDRLGGRQLLRGNLQRNGLHVVAVQRVVTDLGQVPAVQQVEDPQVEEERVVGLPGEHLPATGQRPHRLRAQRRIVGHRRLA